MKILVLGDVMALSGRNAIKKNLDEILKKIKLIFQLLMVRTLLMTVKELLKK